MVPFFGGGGALTCVRWTEEHKKPNSILAFAMDGWVTGFASGLAYGQPMSDIDREAFFKEMTENDLMNGVHSYCRQHPDSHVIQAALMVSAGLELEMAKRIRAAINKAKRKQ